MRSAFLLKFKKFLKGKKKFTLLRCVTKVHGLLKVLFSQGPGTVLISLFWIDLKVIFYWCSFGLLDTYGTVYTLPTNERNNQTNEETNERTTVTNKRTNQRTDGRLNELGTYWTNKSTNKPTNKPMKERTNERRNESMYDACRGIPEEPKFCNICGEEARLCDCRACRICYDETHWWKVHLPCRMESPTNRVVDPHWFNADPDTDTDTAFFLIADPDSVPNPGFWWLKI